MSFIYLVPYLDARLCIVWCFDRPPLLYLPCLLIGVPRLFHEPVTLRNLWVAGRIVWATLHENVNESTLALGLLLVKEFPALHNLGLTTAT